MSGLILPGDELKTPDGRKAIVLPDGSLHLPEVAPENPSTPWEILQREISVAGPVFQRIYRDHRHIIRATLVEAMAFQHMSKVA